MQPTTQQYRNPLKWGWYYVDEGQTTTQLMSKRAARRWFRETQRYGAARICTHNKAPAAKLIRRNTFPVRSLS